MADRIRVLYVDDEPGLLQIAQLFLEKSGEFKVETLTSAQEALDSSSIQSCDAIISDFQMPEMDGIAFLKAVRERFGDLPFILFTGRGREEVVIDAINNGVDFYLQKGGEFQAQFAELAHKIRQAVNRRRADHLRTESEKRLLDIINFLPDATFAIDRSGILIAWNRAMEEMTGRSWAEMLGKGDYEYATPFYGTRRPILIDLVFASRDEVRQKYSFVRADKGGLTAETTNATPRGKTCVLWGRAAPLINYEGVTIGAIESIRDITKSKTAQENLARSKDYLDQIFSSVKAGIVIIDSLTHQIVDINPAGAAMIGLPKEQIIGNICHKFICPAETGQCPITDLHKNVDNTERMLITGDGKKIPIIKYVTRTNLDGRECLLETFIDNSERRLAEDALRKSEEKYRLLTEVTDDVIYMVDLQGTLTHISPQVVRYGYTQDEVLFHNFTEFIAEEDIPNIITDYKNAVSTRTQTITTIRIRDKAGNLHWMEDNGAPVINDSGSVIAISGILRDITTRKRAEDAQKESEEKFRSIFENSPYPIAISSIPDNKFLEVNKAFLDISGYTPAEILGKDPIEMGFLPFTETLKLISHRLLTGKIENVPLAVTAKGGKRIHVLFSTMPITINNKSALVTVTAEVTKLKRVEEELLQKNEDLNAAYEELTATEEELRQNYNLLTRNEEMLRESEVKYRDLAELLPQMIFETDLDLRITYANRQAFTLLGFTDQDLERGITALSLIDPSQHANMRDNVQKSLNGISFEPGEYTALRKDGSTFPVIIYSTPVNRNTALAGFRAVVVDISARKKMEQGIFESEKKFRAFVEFSLDGIFITDFSGNLLFVNRAAGAIIDASDHEALIGKRNVMEFVAPESQADVLRDISQVVQGTDAYLVNYKLVTETKREVWVECIGKKIPYGDSFAMLVSMRDVTQRKLAEEHLRESENKFVTVFRSSPVSLTLVSATEGKFIDVNDAFLRNTGYSRDEVIGRMAEDVGIFADTSEYEGFVSALRKQRTVDGRELKCRIKTGAIRICRFTAGVILMGGRPHILSSVEDITEQKEAEETLRESGEKFRSLIETSPDIIWEIDLQGKIRYISPMGTTILGYTPEELVGKRITDLIPEQDRSSVMQELSVYITSKGSYQPFEVPALSRDGREIILEIRPAKVLSADTRLQGFRGVARDITERRKTEKSLHESELLFREVFDNANDAVYLVERARDGPGRYRLVNDTAVQMLGYSKEELLEMSPRDIVPVEIAKKNMPELRQKLVRDGHATFESANRRKDGTIIPIEVSLRAFRYKGKDVDLSIIRDITERKRDLEALRQANKKLNLLSGITRHDIKNQLMVLNGFTTLLHQKIPDPSYETYFSRIMNASNQITNMIQFTKEYEQIGVHSPIWQDIRNLVDTAIGDVALDQVVLKNDLPATTEVFADPLIGKVIFNLVDNAVRHGGEITTIRFSLEECDGNRIIVCEDDGEGVVVDEKERIFDLGFGKSTGFGLAISREILDITGITITENGEPGEGARFEIEVPKNQYRFVS